MLGERPTQHLEACHLRPRRIGDEKRIVSDVERWPRPELTTPLPNGANMLKMFVQLVQHHTQHVRELTVADFIFEVRDDNALPSEREDSALSLGFGDQASRCVLPLSHPDPELGQFLEPRQRWGL
jgi:hypothetical protein